MFQFDLPPLEVGYQYKGRFGPILPPFPIFAILGGSVSTRINLGFGYDTAGLLRFADSGDIGDVFDGFFIADRDKSNRVDISEVILQAAIFAGAELYVSWYCGSGCLPVESMRTSI